MSGARFVPTVPVRAVDTRESAIVGGKRTISVPVAGVPGAVAGATAVVVNVTVTAAEAAGFLTAWGDGGMPATSSLNFSQGDTVAATAVVQLRGDGTIQVHNGSARPAHVVVDVMGWWANSSGGGYQAVTPTRLLDTRERDLGHHGIVPGDTEIRVPVRGQGGVSGTATGALVNITIADPDAATFVSVYPSGTELPLASILNTGHRQVRANLAAVKCGADGAIALRHKRGNAHLIVDVLGYFAPEASGGLHMLPPVRVFDSREHAGGEPLHPREVVDLPFWMTPGVPGGARAVIANVTLVQPTEGTYVSTYPSGAGAPTVSTVNLAPQNGQPWLAMCNNTFLQLDNYGYGSVRHWAGRSHMVIDVMGYLI